MNDAEPVADQHQSDGLVFLSYATADHREALNACKAIEQRGARCWISTRDVPPGANYQEAIVRSLRASRAMVLIFSGAANNSDEIKKELSLASRYHVPVMALRIENVEPGDAFTYELSTRQWIDAFKNRKEAVDQLVRRLSEVSESPTSGHDVASSSERTGPLRVTRRGALVAGGVVVISGGALTWFGIGHSRIPPQVRLLLDEGEAALDEGTVDQFATAVARFKRATEIAPDRAEPWGALALAYERQASLAQASQEQELHLRSDESRRRALSIDPQNPDALAAGVARLPLYSNWLANERACRSALANHPDHVPLNTMLAIALAQVGRMREALAHVDRAYRVSPKSVLVNVLRVLLLRDNRRPDEADSVAEAAHRARPRNYAIWFTRLYQLAFGGRAPEALAMIDDRGSRPVGIPEWNFAVTRLQVQALGSRTAADVDAAVRASVDAAHRGAGFAEGAIMFAASLGRVDDAYRVIDGYFFDRGFRLPEARYTEEQGTFSAPKKRVTYMLFSPLSQPLRDDRRFKPLTAALGLDTYWRQSSTKPDYLT